MGDSQLVFFKDIPQTFFRTRTNRLQCGVCTSFEGIQLDVGYCFSSIKLATLKASCCISCFHNIYICMFNAPLQPVSSWLQTHANLTSLTRNRPNAKCHAKFGGAFTPISVRSRDVHQPVIPAPRNSLRKHQKHCVRGESPCVWPTL